MRVFIRPSGAEARRGNSNPWGRGSPEHVETHTPCPDKVSAQPEWRPRGRHQLFLYIVERTESDL